MGSILSLPWKEGLEIAEIDINGLLDGIIESTDTGKSEARIVREFSPLPPVQGNASALRQVFLNLISNACDAVEGRMDATIRVATSAPGKDVIVRVQDNGNGIPSAILKTIFEPFFTTKESKQGAGLGLSLCREFLTHAGGSVRAESRPGRGSTFVVTLPAKGAGRP
jgi:signal transduction histidine kinase